VPSKSEISSWERKQKFLTGNGSDMAVPLRLFASKYVLQLLGLEGSYPSTSGFLAWACRCKIVAIPPRILFSIIKYLSGSVMRSSLAFVYFKADAHASDGRVIKWRGQKDVARKPNSEILKDIGQQKDVRKKEMVSRGNFS